MASDKQKSVECWRGEFVCSCMRFLLRPFFSLPHKWYSQEIDWNPWRLDKSSYLCTPSTRLTLGLFNLETAFYVILSNAICCTMSPELLPQCFSALVCSWMSCDIARTCVTGNKNLSAKFRLFALNSTECHRYRVGRECFAGKSLRWPLQSQQYRLFVGILCKRYKILWENDDKSDKYEFCI